MNLIITGGTRGLGLEIATQQLIAGHTIVIMSRFMSTGLQSLMSEYSNRLFFVPTDLTEPQLIKEKFDSPPLGDMVVHGLVNNAASAYDDLVSNIDLSALDAMFRINVYSPMILTKLVIRKMLLHRIKGSVVHISSISAHAGYKGLAMYAASKGAIESFSKNVAREWGTLGIRSNCVVPGFMETEMTESLSSEQKERIFRRTCLNTATSTSSVASMVGYLLSDLSSSVTGQEFVVDSGTI
ncbi:MAG: SDR family oxidoreductase [Planctomycetales bacterium]|nr:SDR family oxidoreductase [Planctomycetales bacterium]